VTRVVPLLWSARTCPRFWQATCRRQTQKAVPISPRAAGRGPAWATSRQSGQSGDKSLHSKAAARHASGYSKCFGVDAWCFCHPPISNQIRQFRQNSSKSGPLPGSDRDFRQSTGRINQERLYKFPRFGVYGVTSEHGPNTRLVRKAVSSESRRVDPLRPGAGSFPRRGRGRGAGNVSGPAPTGNGAGQPRALLRAQLPKSGAQLPALVLAAADAGVGIAALVRARRGGIARRAGRDALSGGIAGAPARSHCAQALASLHV